MDNIRKNDAGENRRNGKNRIEDRSRGTRRIIDAYGDPREPRVSQRQPYDGSRKSGSQKKYEQNRKRKRQRRNRIRAAAVIFSAAAVAVILVFMTPVFSIGQIRVEGNNVVDISVIQAKIGDLVGENLFRTRKSSIEQKMLEIPQLSSASIKKNYFPPSLTITVTETTPAAYVLSNNKIVVIDSTLKVIDDSGTYSAEELPSISGVSVGAYELNKTISTDSEEKGSILQMLLHGLERTGMLANVTYISVDDITDIKFNYDNRIEVLCGSQLELERKLRMFAETMNSPTLKSNSLGTIDLSVPGKAIYKP